ncbi:MAG: DUF433 domain-containing protein [Anaerolineae bacterium]|nr:DUF433 domain-containing protein [Anaerolineae bacterium]
MSADEIANQYDLTLSQVYAALTYYFDHMGVAKFVCMSFFDPHPCPLSPSGRGEHTFRHSQIHL